MYIEWKDAYCIGVSAIDDQHYQLIEMLNELYEKIGHTGNSKEIWLLLAGFNRYADTHFAAEERIAREGQVPHGVLTAHRAEHEAYRDRMVAFRRAFEASDRHAPVQLLAFLSTWWLNHILIEDMELGRLIQAPMQGPV